MPILALRQVRIWDRCASDVQVRVGIVGSRKFTDPVGVWEWMARELFPGDVVITGGCHGPDAWAANIAHYVLGLEVVVHWADWKGLGKRAGFARNGLIAKDCDRLVAFHDGVSHGTADTMQKASKLGKMVEVLIDRRANVA